MELLNNGLMLWRAENFLVCSNSTSIIESEICYKKMLGLMLPWKLITSNCLLYLWILAGDLEPNLADLAVFGVLRPIRHLKSGRDMVEHTRIGKWFSEMEHAVGQTSRMSEHR
jgi:hypothetical protein